MYPQNLHTHSVYCDGKNTPEEIVLEALRLGLTGIGFSTHAKCAYSDYPLPADGVAQGFAEIERLKGIYKDRIDIFNGLEHDMYCGADTKQFDFVLGAMHYLKMGDTYVAFDRDVTYVTHVIDVYFGGDGMAFAKEYYRQLATLPQYVSADIVAHFDTVSKLCEKQFFFDIESREYLCCAFEALHALVEKIPFFEVNTGAMARGYRTVPYPTLSILKELHAAGGRVLISSDCHDLRYLTHGFDTALGLIEAAGFDEIYLLTGQGFVPLSLARCR